MPRSRLTAAVGAAIRELRHGHTTLSQEPLAHAAGLHRTYLGVLEHGEANPTLVTLEQVAQALGVAVSDLIRRAEGVSTRSTPSAAS